MKKQRKRMKKKSNLDIINDAMIAKYGEIKPEWKTLIEMYCDNLDLYAAMQQTLKETGLYDPNTGKKNPLISSIKDIQTTMMKQQQKLAISPWDESKINITNEEDDDFLSELNNE
ncbi:MAG: P27 family phage terminase small subunit [Clostridia bacterium]|nr:P27 family phage terminase small subunit [Clostridia bacterium]